jgi:nicotinamide-nucleotide amidase
MNAEIVMIGTELLLGQIVDTNSAHLGRVLAENGVGLYRKTTVGDNFQRIINVLDGALDRADVILTSGGLGPTEDDITRECIAELTGRPLEFRDDLYAQLEARFARINRPITENNRKQAMAPEGATAIPNPNGTAPGLIVEDKRGIIISMPGVPRELYAMLDESVIPFLRERFGIAETLRYRVLKVCGLGESRVDELIGDIIQRSDNPKIGLLASPESVRIRISCLSRDADEAHRLIDEVDAQVRERLPGLVMGIDEDTLEGVIDGLLHERGWRLAVAESHTGGMIAQRMIAAGAGALVGGCVAPPNPARRVDVEAEAQVMLDNLLRRYEADAQLVLASDVESGQALLRIAAPDINISRIVRFAGLNDFNQLRSSIIALEHLRRALLGIPEETAADAKA